MSILTKPKKVLIAGSGFAGNTLAIALAQRGIASEIFDKSPEAVPALGGSITLAPNALRVTDLLGIWKELTSHGHVFETMHILTNTGGVIGTFANGSVEKYGYEACRIRRSTILTTMVEKQKQYPDLIKRHYGKRFVNIKQDDNGATLVFDDGSEVSGDYLVAADGIHSTIRPLLFPGHEPTYVGTCSIGGSVDMSLLKDIKLPALVHGVNGTMGLMPFSDQTKDEQLAAWFVTLDGIAERDRKGWKEFRESGEAVEEARKHVEGWGDPAESILKTATPESTFVWTQYQVPAMSHWYQGRVILVGDAAHAMPPSGGQGSNQALEDSYLLARVFDEGGTLEAWQQERHKRLEIAGGLTKMSGKSRETQSSSWLRFQIKVWSMKLFFTFKGLGDLTDRVKKPLPRRALQAFTSASAPQSVPAPAPILAEDSSDANMEDVSTGSDSDYANSWIAWFLSTKGNEYFCEIDEEYILDRFNLTGLNSEVHHYSQALDLITDQMDEELNDDMRDSIEGSARHLYGLIHARFIITSRGLSKMVDKYKKADFGRCPRVLCYSQPLLPVGLADVPYQKAVKLYCPRCEDIYSPKSSRHAAIDGAYFGSTFPHMLFMVHSHLVPVKSLGPNMLGGTGPSTASVTAGSLGTTAGMSASGQAGGPAAALKAERYRPRIFGFMIHESAKLHRWQEAVRDQQISRLEALNQDIDT